jgi:hypothetical protein
VIETLIRVIRENRLVVIAFAALIVIIVIIALVAGGDSEDAGPPAAEDATTTTRGVDLFDADEGVYADVSPLDCFALLDRDEVYEALASPEIPEDQRGTSGFGQGEVCTERAVADERYFVRLEPGDPADFESGGTLLGVAGERVADIGEEALWFGGPGTVDGGASGAISVRQTTALGMLYFRMVLGRPDLQTEEQLDIARALAAGTLARFPGMPVGPPDPLVDLCDLVTDDEAEAVLSEYRDAHPATRDEVFVTSNFGGTVDLSDEGEAVCNKLILAEIYIEMQQASEADFGSGAQMEGIAGEPAAGIGDQAVWFADVPYQGSFTAPHLRSVLAVRQGEASFRIALALPDTDSTDQLEIAGRLAAGALGRIPGAEDLPQPAVIIEPDSIDPAQFSLEGNLRAKVEAGEWTMGEGLVATLQLILGRAEPDDVLRHREVGDSNATEIITLAAAYAQEGPDLAAREEVAALLELLIPSEEVLSGAFGTDDADAAAHLPSPVRVASSQPSHVIATPAFNSRSVLAIQAEDEGKDFCLEYYGITGGGCLTRVPMPDVEAMWPGKYQLGRLKEETWPGQTERADWAVEAVFDSAIVFEQLGEMPKVLVLLLPQDLDYVGPSEGVLEGPALTGDTECFAVMGDKAQQETAFKQRLASFLAWCLLMDGPDASTVGMMIYLSGVVYPDFNEEHVFSPQLQVEELLTTLPDRNRTNWALFEFMHPFVGGGTDDRLGGALGNLGLLPEFPDSAGPFLHQYALGLTDSNVGDIDPDGGVIPYSPPASLLNVSGPIQPFNLAPPEYGVRRLHVVVDPGMYACLSDPAPSGDLEASWREGQPGEEGDWVNPPATIEGHSVLVVTATGPDTVYNFGVKKVSDNEDCEEEKRKEETIPPPAGDVLPCCLSEFFRILTELGG